jgi:hypothetical protein
VSLGEGSEGGCLLLPLHLSASCIVRGLGKYRRMIHSLGFSIHGYDPRILFRERLGGNGPAVHGMALSGSLPRWFTSVQDYFSTFGSVIVFRSKEEDLTIRWIVCLTRPPSTSLGLRSVLQLYLGSLELSSFIYRWTHRSSLHMRVSSKPHGKRKQPLASDVAYRRVKRKMK